MTKRKRPRSAAKPHRGLAHTLAVHRVELRLQDEKLTAARAETDDMLERYREVFDFAPIGYATLEDIDTIKEINLAGVALLGADQPALVNSRFTTFVASHSLAAFAELLAAAKTHGAPRVAELDLWIHARPVPAQLRAVQLRRTKPTILLAFEDVSERTARELALARTQHALQEQARRKDEFLGVLSHELRNPLAPIRTSVAVLEMLGTGSDMAREAVSIIARSSEHLTRLVDDLLDITRITSGKIQLRRETLDLGVLVRQAVEEHAPVYASHQLVLETRLAAGPLWVHGDPARLLQILHNLLGNAEKFSLPGGGVTVATERVDRTVLLRVRDNGIGIDPEVLGQLGEPFIQAPQALDRSRGGLGLGLAMVRSLAELHGGTIAIRSDGLDKGTEVIVSLPEHTEPAVVVATGAPVAASPRRVLVIEDNPDAARSIAMALSLRGHAVEVVGDGRQGIARAKAYVPDVVLCDIGLPDVDGYSVARRLRRFDELRQVALVALTGYTRPEDITQALAAGFDRHVAKPVTTAQLDQLLAELPRR